MKILPIVLILTVVIGVSLWLGTRDVEKEATPLPQQKTHIENNSVEPSKEPDDVKKSPDPQHQTTLDMHLKGLTSVPQDIFSKSELEVLDLSGNEFSGALQAEIRNLQNLKTLDLSNNKFTGIPAEIGQLKNLEVLDLSNNQLTGLPHELGNLSNLKELKIGGNQYSETDLEIIKSTLPNTTKIVTQ